MTFPAYTLFFLVAAIGVLLMQNECTTQRLFRTNLTDAMHVLAGLTSTSVLLGIICFAFQV